MSIAVRARTPPPVRPLGQPPGVRVVESVVLIGDAEIDLVERRVHSPRGEGALTELEASLLRFLLGRRGSTTSRKELLEEVWGYSPRTVTRAVDHTVSRLRKKIEVDPRRPRWLTSTRGGGYRLELPPVEVSALPEEPSSFLGRQEEIERLAAALDQHRVVALLGLGGVGKSRLALRVAMAWRDRGLEVVVVSLGGETSAAGARGRVARSLGVEADRVADALDGQEHLLVVLDEVERLEDSVLDFVRAPDGPRFLLTSQRPEPVADHTVEIGPMPLVDSAALVAARCPVPLSEADAQRIAEALDGVPFAIELAAQWLAAAPPDDVLDRLHTLRGRGDGRHSTVTAALLGSWALLGADGRALLGEAALFAAPFRIADLEAVSGRADAMATAADLVARGWLVRAEDRLGMATVVRQFLRGEGAVPADGPARHAAWLSSWVPALRQAQDRRWSAAAHDRLTRAEPDLRAAIAAHEHPDAAAPLLVALYRTHGDGSVPMDDARAEVEAVAARLGPASPWHATLQTLSAGLALSTGDHEAAWRRAEAGYAALTDAPDPHLQCVLDGVSAQVLLARGQPQEAVARFRSAIGLAVGLGSLQGAGTYRMNLALLVARDDPAAAVSMLVEALDELVDVGNPGSIGRIHANLARLLRAQGAAEAAASHHERAEALLREAGDRRALAQLLLNQSHHLLDVGERASARRVAEEALALARRIGLRQSAALAMLTLAHLHLDERAPASALDLALAAQRSLRRGGNLWTLAEAAWCVGHAELALGRPDSALAAFEEGVNAVRRAGGRSTDPFVAGLAVARLAAGDRVGAEACLAEIGGHHAAIVAAALEGRRPPEDAPDVYARILAHAARRR
jgi:DNA-binding winged helix-turn-helix (wHTH) protein/tetratricopeptide (TPR) repeat protein